MWRKTINRVEDKSKIKLRQQEISRSVNQLESTSQKLISNNLLLLEELHKKEKQQIIIDEKRAELIVLKENAEKEYLESKNKLDILNVSIKNLETNNTSKLKEQAIKEQAIKEKQDKLEKEFIKQEKTYSKQIDNLNNECILLWLDKNQLKSDKNDLQLSITSLSKIEIDKSKNIKEQEKILKSLKNEIEKNEDVYFSSNLQKQIIETEILDLKDNKKIALKEFNKTKSELSEVQDTLAQEKEELKKTKEINLVLIKREEILNSRETYIKEYYRKAWLPFN
jgi:hypothetical protein